MNNSYVNRIKNISFSRILGNFKAPIPTDEIKDTLISLGIKEGDRLFVHSSFGKFYHGGDTSLLDYFYRLSAQGHEDYAKKIIQIFFDIIGVSGVLMFPGDFLGDELYSTGIKKVWDLSKERTRSRGFLPEIFRNWPGTVRSTHPVYPVTVNGGGFEKEVNNHWDLPYTMDVGSPWYKLMQVGGKIILFGVGYQVNSALRLSEHVLKNDYPHPMFFNRPFSYTVKNYEGRQKEVHAYLLAVRAYRLKVSTNIKFCEYLNDKYGIYKSNKVRGVNIITVKLKDQFDAIMAELENGVTWYDAMHWD